MMETAGQLILAAMVVFSSTTTVQAQSSTSIVEPPWEFQTFDFGWAPYNDTITQCRNVQFQWTTRANAAAQPAPPYTINFWRAGYQPYIVNVGSGVPVGTPGEHDFGWIVNLPTGGPYMTSMFDSTGNIGGSTILFNILAAQGPQCTIQTLTPQSLNFTISDVESSCGTIAVNVTGGTPPYKLGVLPENYPPKFMYYSTGAFDYVLDVPGGMNVFFVVEDSQGQYAVAPAFPVGNSTNMACLTVASTLVPGNPALSTIYPGLDVVPTSTASSNATGMNNNNNNNQSHSSHSHIGLIVGVAVAGVVAVILAGFLLWWKCIHRARDENSSHDIDATNIPHPIIEPFQPTLSMGQVVAFPHTPSTFFTQDGERALLAAQQGDVKPITPSTPSRSPYTPSSSSYFPNSSPDPRLSGYDPSAVSGDEPLRRSTASPPLPPGAAPPTPSISSHFGSEGAGSLQPFLPPGAAKPDAFDRFKTPPPQYTER